VIGGGKVLELKRAGANFLACARSPGKPPASTSVPSPDLFIASAATKAAMFFKFVMEHEAWISWKRSPPGRPRKNPWTRESPVEQQTRHVKEKLLQIHEQTPNDGRARWPTSVRPNRARLLRNEAYRRRR